MIGVLKIRRRVTGHIGSAIVSQSFRDLELESWPKGPQTPCRSAKSSPFWRPNCMKVQKRHS